MFHLGRCGIIKKKQVIERPSSADGAKEHEEADAKDKDWCSTECYKIVH